MMRTALYYLGLAALFTHEMDAVPNAEWRLLYGLRDLPDPDAYAAFLLLHVPLFAAVIWLSHHGRAAVRRWFRRGAAAFLVIHAGLHLGLSGSPRYAFEGPLSNGLILGAALCGLGYLALSWRSRRA